MGKTRPLPSSQLQQFLWGCTWGHQIRVCPRGHRYCTPRAEFVFPRWKKNYYLPTWEAATRLTRAVKETVIFVSGKENKCNISPGLASAEAGQLTPRISTLPQWGEKSLYKAEWDKWSFHCRWRVGNVADSQLNGLMKLQPQGDCSKALSII